MPQPRVHRHARPSLPAHSRGVSLLETAVVLFLLTLLISGTLHGQEVVNMAQVGNVARDFQDISTMVYSYQDKFRALPGDDRRATAHLGSPDMAEGNGNSRIDGRWFDTGAASEAALAWQHLRQSGVAGGTPDPAAPGYMALNALGKQIGLQSGTGDPALTPIRDAAGNVLAGSILVCSRGIPGKMVQTLDIKLDDGNPASGGMLATPDTGSAYAPGAPAATLATGTASDITPDALYIVCRGV